MSLGPRAPPTTMQGAVVWLLLTSFIAGASAAICPAGEYYATSAATCAACKKTEFKAQEEGAVTAGWAGGTVIRFVPDRGEGGAACIAACRATQGCIAAAWSVDSTGCYLFSAITDTNTDTRWRAWGLEGRTSCTAKKTACPADKYFTDSADSTADATCTPCSADTVKVGTNSQTSCTSCQQTEFIRVTLTGDVSDVTAGWLGGSIIRFVADRGDGGAACIAACHATQGCIAAAWSVGDTGCYLFSAITDSNTDTRWRAWRPAISKSCAVKKTTCPAGEYFTNSPLVSTTADATCTPCNATAFKVGTNSQTSCTAKKTTCPADKYFTDSADSTADATCTPCSADTVKVGTNSQTSCTSCQQTEFIRVTLTGDVSDVTAGWLGGSIIRFVADRGDGGAACIAACHATQGCIAAACTAGATCKECSVGKHQDEAGGQTTCKDCGVGQHQDQTSQPGCKECGVGRYQDQQAQANCKSCPAGTYQHQLRQAAQAACNGCPAGQHQPAAACAAGRYQDLEGQAMCKAGGMYQDQQKKTVCKACGTGTQGSEVRAKTGEDVQCKSCTAGQFGQKVGAISCRYSESDNRPECKNCPTGKFLSQPGRPFCETCTEGKVCDTPTKVGNETDELMLEPRDCPEGFQCTTKEVLEDRPCRKDGKRSDNATGKCVSCEDQQFSALDGNGCIACPDVEGVDCKHGLITIRDGYFVVPDTDGSPGARLGESMEILPCQEDGVCRTCDAHTGCLSATVHTECLRSTAGPLCALCAPGYGKTAGMCASCPDSTTQGLIVAGVLMTMAVMLYMMVHKSVQDVAGPAHTLIMGVNRRLFFKNACVAVAYLVWPAFVLQVLLFLSDNQFGLQLCAAVWIIMVAVVLQLLYKVGSQNGLPCKMHHVDA
eukprot:g1647.t1